MNIQRILMILTVIGGLVSGPSSLESAALSQPPIQWSDMPIFFFGCLISLLFVLWFQVVIGNLKAAYYFWQFFVFCGLFFLASGVSAFVTAEFGAGLSPDAFLFLIIGAGICFSTFICKLLFSKKWYHLTPSRTPNSTH
jgi:predicted tellurium resistance membrane protein TerC